MGWSGLCLPGTFCGLGAGGGARGGDCSGVDSEVIVEPGPQGGGSGCPGTGLLHSESVPLLIQGEFVPWVN